MAAAGCGALHFDGIENGGSLEFGDIQTESLCLKNDAELRIYNQASKIYQPDSQWLERASKDAFAAGMQKLQDLRALLFTYQTAIPEYVGRMQKVWPAATKFSIPAGICIFHLCV